MTTARHLKLFWRFLIRDTMVSCLSCVMRLCTTLLAIALTLTISRCKNHAVCRTKTPDTEYFGYHCIAIAIRAPFEHHTVNQIALLQASIKNVHIVNGVLTYSNFNPRVITPGCQKPLPALRDEAANICYVTNAMWYVPASESMAGVAPLLTELHEQPRTACPSLGRRKYWRRSDKCVASGNLTLHMSWLELQKHRTRSQRTWTEACRQADKRTLNPWLH